MNAKLLADEGFIRPDVDEMIEAMHSRSPNTEASDVLEIVADIIGWIVAVSCMAALITFVAFGLVMTSEEYPETCNFWMGECK